MRKSLLIGLIVCVLALGGIGAAFATDLDFTNVGALSAGQTSIPQVNVDGITWQVYGAYPQDYVCGVRLSFDRDLGALTEFNVVVLGSGGTVLANVWDRGLGPVLASGYVVISFIAADDANHDIYVAPANALGVPVSDVYGIRVLVSEETVP